MINVLILVIVLMSPVTGAIWSTSSPPHDHDHEVVVKDGRRIVTEFKDNPLGNTEVSVSEQDSGGFTGKCKNKLASVFKTTKNVLSEKTHVFRSLEQRAKEVVDETVGKVGDPKEKLSDKLSGKAKSVGEKVMEVAGNAKNAVGKTIGMVSMEDSTKGSLKDSLVKIEEWDLVDSPKRIGEDIERNASRKIEQGSEEVKETVENVKETVENIKETPLNELLTKFKNMVHDVFSTLLRKTRSVISWCHLLGFSVAYGMGIWVTFFSSCVLGKCLPKQQFGMVLNKMHMVYFKAMGYCVGATVFGYLVSQGRKGVLSNKMAVFQGFNLVSALCMVLTNLVFLEPQITKLIVERMKIQKTKTQKTEIGQKKFLAERLKKLSTYSSTLNVSTMVVLTWHLAYIGQLLQARR